MAERKPELVTNDDYGAVITAWTPLETVLLGVHPRLHLTAEGFDKLRERVASGQEPWATMMSKLKQTADHYANQTPVPKAESITGDRRGLGDLLATLSLAWQLTKEPKYLDAARAQLRTMVTYPQSIWDAGLTNGHWLYGHAIAYDWLYHDLDDETLSLVRENLYATLARSVDFLALHKGWMADAYACNHLPVHMAGLIAGAAAIYAEKPGVGPWLKFASEKLGVMSGSLGPDGLSQESMGYGEYYCAYFLKALDIAQLALGLNFVNGSMWLKNYPASQYYLTLGSKSSKTNGAIFGFGDGMRTHWYGPSFMLRRIASAFRDGFAQAFAAQCDQNGTSNFNFLDLLWHDPSVKPSELSRLPLFHHFVDKGVVAARSHWNGDEVVWMFKNGPHFGHHAAMRYPHDVGGGHMQPDNGSLQIAVRDERLLAIDGYFRKETAINNTVLVNGIGQLGDGREWFEGLELRFSHRFPRILSAQSKDKTEMIVADVTLAYRPEAKLQRFVRSVLHQQGIWLVIDELLAEPSSLFEAFFHSDYQMKEVEGGEGCSFVAEGPTAALRMTAVPLHTATSVSAKVITQKSNAVGGHHGKERPTFVVSAKQTGNEIVRFATVMQIYPLSIATLPPVPKTKTRGSGAFLDSIVSIGPVDITLKATPEDSKPAAPTAPKPPTLRY